MNHLDAPQPLQSCSIVPSDAGYPDSAKLMVERELDGGLLESKCAARLRGLAFFLDCSRLVDLVVCRVQGRLDLLERDAAEALTDVIDETILELVLNDELGDELGDAPASISQEHIQFMNGVGVLASRIHGASRRFNGLPFPLRKTFRMLCLEGIPIEQCVARGMGSTEVIGGAVHHCFQALLRDWPLQPIPRAQQPIL